MEYDETALQAVREGRLLINNYDKWLFETFEPFIGQRVLEVGCGLGNLMVHLLDRELVMGIEVAANAVRDVKQRFAKTPNITVRQIDIVKPDALALGKYKLDTAVSMNVLEHIEDDETALANIGKILVPGGHVILVLPAHTWLYGTMDVSIGHYRRYTREMLRERVENAGFQVVTDGYVNSLGALGWWFNGRVLHKQVPPKAQLNLFNIVVPVQRFIERIFPTPFGISVMMVAQKI